MAVTTYAMESMAYLTALTLDSYQQPDASVEAAIVKVRYFDFTSQIKSVIVLVLENRYF